jgi:hypothetical protein
MVCFLVCSENRVDENGNVTMARLNASKVFWPKVSDSSWQLRRNVLFDHYFSSNKPLEVPSDDKVALRVVSIPCV